MSDFGTYIRNKREKLRATDRGYSVRQVAARIGVEPSYLSKVERGEQPPPSEKTIVGLATDLNEDPDVLLALAGKVSRPGWQGISRIAGDYLRAAAAFCRAYPAVERRPRPCGAAACA